MAILNNNPLVGASGNQGGYNINNSLRFRSSASAYLSRTPASAGNRTTWTWSCWVKKTPLASGVQAMIAAGVSATVYDDFCFENDQIRVVFNNGTYDVRTTQVFRDPSAWYHVILAMDTTQATSSNRVKIYVNGTQVTAFATANYPVQNHNTNINNNILNNIGNLYNGSFSSYFDGYLAEVNFIDGSAKTPSDFGETDTTTGVWKPKKYTGTYGTNGFYLKFSDIATTSGSNAGLGKDFSGNSNYWTTNNISVTSGTTYDAMTDSPTNTSATVANYATLNATAPYGSSLTLSEGNLRTTCAGAYWAALPATFLIPTTGKWYWEVKAVVATNMPYDSNISIGITRNISSQYNTGQDQWSGYTADSYGVTNDVSSMYKWTNVTPTAYGASYTISDVIGVGLDMDAGTLTYYKNGVSQGVAFSGLTGNFVPSLGVNNTGTSAVINFGQRPFSYTPPTGFVALNTYNLPTPTILQGNKYMDATLYTGNGSTQTITNAAGFRPDLVWQKPRSEVASHRLVDSVRGVNNVLYSNQTAAASTETNTLTAFNSNGFTGGGSNAVTSGNTAVAWQWQGGQGSTSSNTNGSITTTTSVSTTAGFSIIQFTGTQANATIGHGLGVAPRMVIVKTYGGGTRGWRVYHASIGNTGYLILNDTSATTTDSTAWNNTTPTSTVISLGANGETNNGGSLMIAYAWAEIAGFSRFGSYTGNGSTNGPFVYTGFRPKYVMIKGNAVVNWWILDTSRNTYNVANEGLLANSSAATNATINPVDFVSNGFKLRDSNGEINANGTTYLYACFAESPFKNSLAR